MNTETPADATAGDVYVVLAPLAVEVGVNEPQAGGLGVQLHCTPAAAESLVTVAATLAVPPPASEVGGGVDRVTTMPTIVTDALPLLAWSVAEVAMMTAERPAGAVAAAVRFVQPP